VIKKRGRVFWLDLWVGPKRLRRSLRTDERAVAIERARDLTLELRKPKPPGMPFAEFAEKYKEWARATKPASYRTEAYRVAIIKAWLEGQGLLTLEQISTHAVEQLRAWVMTKRIGHTTKTIGRSSANRYCAMLRTIFNKARDWGDYGGENPVSKVKFYREPQKTHPLSTAEVRSVLAAARTIQADPRSPIQRIAADLIVILLNTGLRRSEALGLRWRDYNGDEVVVIGKGERRRVVPINDEARAVIERQPRTGIYILPIPNRAQTDNLRRTVKRIRKVSGVAHFHLHLCRHYAMTAMLGAGVDIQTASEILGHSRFSTSLLYAHSTPERRRRAVEVISLDTPHGHRPADVEAQVAEK